MTPEIYLVESARTEYTPDSIRLHGDRIDWALLTPAQHIEETLKSVEDREFAALLHAAMGLTTETGEFMDALKKRWIYGKPLDRVNLIEEIGDKLWYAALALRALGSSFEEAMNCNIAKLRKRFPGKFTADAALNRDLGAEREALEGDHRRGSSQGIDDI